MTCVFDSLITKIPSSRLTPISASLRTLKGAARARCFLTFLQRRLCAVSDSDIQAIAINGSRPTSQQVREIRAALADTTVGDGYLMSTFDPLYIATCAAFNVNIKHTWRAHSRTTVINYRRQVSDAQTQSICFKSSATHTS